MVKGMVMVGEKDNAEGARREREGTRLVPVLRFCGDGAQHVVPLRFRFGLYN